MVRGRWGQRWGGFSPQKLYNFYLFDGCTPCHLLCRHIPLSSPPNFTLVPLSESVQCKFWTTYVFNRVLISFVAMKNTSIKCAKRGENFYLNFCLFSSIFIIFSILFFHLVVFILICYLFIWQYLLYNGQWVILLSKIENFLFFDWVCSEHPAHPEQTPLLLHFWECWLTVVALSAIRSQY